MNPIKPCLSCGEVSDFSIGTDTSSDLSSPGIYAYHVVCLACGARGRNRTRIGWCESENEAIQAWNNREHLEPSIKHTTQNHHVSFSIEPHGPEGQFALYLGRSGCAHGLNLCQLSDFDRNGEKVRADIVHALNLRKESEHTIAVCRKLSDMFS